MNHSEAPNTDFSAYGGGTATRDIAAGEELTCNITNSTKVSNSRLDRKLL